MSYINIDRDTVSNNLIVVPKTDGGTASLSDNFKILEFANGAVGWVYAIPHSTTVAFPIGSWFEVRKTGTGGLTLHSSAGVVFRGHSGDVNYKLVGEDGYSAFLEKTATDIWLISGSVVTA